MIERRDFSRNLHEIERSTLGKGSVEFRGVEYPSAEDSSCIVSMPFYNEQESLPGVLEGISKSALSDEVYLIGVDHGSEDSSSQVFLAAQAGFKELVVVKDDFAERAPAVPRKTGLDLSLALAKQIDKSLPLATVDVDVVLPINFLEEVVNFGGQFEALVFPMRHNPDMFLKCLEKQPDSTRSVATRSLLGAEWFRFQMRHSLSMAGAIEPNGGGFAISSQAYEEIGGFQPAFSPKGEIVLGANTEFGVKMKKAGLAVKLSSSVSQVSPRRVINALFGRQKTDGYTRTSEGAVTFTDVEYEYKQYPVLQPKEWKEYFDEQVRRGIIVALTRAPFQNCLDNMKPLFGEFDGWVCLLDSLELLYSKHGYINNKLYEEAVNDLGVLTYEKMVSHIKEWVPNESGLLMWAKGEKELIDARVASLSKM